MYNENKIKRLAPHLIRRTLLLSFVVSLCVALSLAFMDNLSAINDLCSKTTHFSWEDITLELQTDNQAAETLSSIILVWKINSPKIFSITHVRNIL